MRFKICILYRYGFKYFFPMVVKMRFRDYVLRVQIGFDSRKERFGFDLGKEKPIEKGLN